MNDASPGLVAVTSVYVITLQLAGWRELHFMQDMQDICMAECLAIM
jgi:hypothetical protein